MDTRYENDNVKTMWSPEWTHAAWLDVECATLEAQLTHPDHPLYGNVEAKELLDLLNSNFVQLDTGEIRRIEKTTKHDVAAFLEFVRRKVGEDCGRWLHWGLTSSDVVDTAQGLRFKFLQPLLLDELLALVSELTRLTLSDEPLVGRTHGQPAEPLTLRVRANHWLGEVAYWVMLLSRATSALEVCKLSGPVGSYAHNPPWVEQRVASALRLRPHGQGASQVALRAPLAAWASAAAGVVEACAKVAVDVRLSKLTGEFQHFLDVGQVGSSAMPHKKNPIQEEQVGGLVRLARGYAQALQPLDLWLERDLSNSCVERVAVPDLWHVLLHTVRTTREFLSRVAVDEDAVHKQYLDSGSALLTSTLTLDELEKSVSHQDARARALNSHVVAVPETALHFVRNYPGGPAK